MPWGENTLFTLEFREEENKYETAMASLREDTEVHQEEKAKHEETEEDAMDLDEGGDCAKAPIP